MRKQKENSKNILVFKLYSYYQQGQKSACVNEE